MVLIGAALLLAEQSLLFYYLQFVHRNPDKSSVYGLTYSLSGRGHDSKWQMRQGKRAA